MVYPRGKKLMDQITMRSMDLHGIETCPLGPARGFREIGDGRLDFLLAHTLGGSQPRRPGDGRWGQGRGSRNRGIGQPSGMVELKSHGRTFGVDGVD